MQPITPLDSLGHIGKLPFSSQYLRGILPFLIVFIYWLDPSARSIMLSAIADAYIAVGVFVAITLFAYYFAEKRFGLNIDALEHKAPIYQITVAAILGALPGCGGAIIVVSQYAAGRVGFAALVTVLVATMGDAAFLLLAKAPAAGALVIIMGVVVGIFSGLVVNYLHSPDFFKKPHVKIKTKNCYQLPNYTPSICWLWVVILMLAFPLTVLSSFQVDSPVFSLLGYQLDSTLLLGVTGALVCVCLWSILPLKTTYRGIVAEDQVALNQQESQSSVTKNNTQILSRVIHDTNFIMVWVLLAFLAFELLVHYTGVELALLFNSAVWVAPLIGVIVGFLPGCGPQIIIASLYLQGIAPLSTLLANAISNDGDALFPAIALAPKAALLATLYSAIPALLVGYAVYIIYQ